MIPKQSGPKAVGAASSSTAALAAAAHNTAAAVEQLTKWPVREPRSPAVQCPVLMENARSPIPRPTQFGKAKQWRKSGQLCLSWTTPLLQHPGL